MKTFLCVIAVCFSLLASGQNKKTVELSGTFNSVDPIIPFGGMVLSSFLNVYAGNVTRAGFATGLTGKYFIAENVAIRFKSIYTKRDLNWNYPGFQGTNSFEDVRNIQTLFKIAPGLQWSLKQKKFSFFSGFEIPLTFIGTIIEQTNLFV